MSWGDTDEEREEKEHAPGTILVLPPARGNSNDDLHNVVNGGIEQAQIADVLLDDLARDNGETEAYAATPYIRELSQHARMRAAFALQWRPTFLAALRATWNITASCRRAGVSLPTIYKHREADPIFAKQWDVAEFEARELIELSLHARGVEGALKAVYCQGVIVGWQREYSDKAAELLIKMKLPGLLAKSEAKHQTIVNNQQNNTVVITAERAAELQARRKRSLEAMKAQQAEIAAATGQMSSALDNGK